MLYSAPGIFNVLDPQFGMLLSGDPTSSAVGNATALQAAINAAQASGNPCGAIVLIPSVDQFAIPLANGIGFYPIRASEGGSSVITIPAPSHPDAPLLICGTGDGTELLMLNAPVTAG